MSKIDLQFASIGTPIMRDSWLLSVLGAVRTCAGALGECRAF